MRHLRLVEAFLNTSDLALGVDQFATAEGLAGWLSEQGLAAAGEDCSDLAVGQAVAVREALRGLALANNGGQLYPVDLATLNAALGETRLRARFLAGGRFRLEPEASGGLGALGRLLSAVAGAMTDGSWRRLKACRRVGCRRAFFDRSPNLSGTWCSMARCGNRVKVSRFRLRVRSAARVSR